MLAALASARVGHGSLITSSRQDAHFSLALRAPGPGSAPIQPLRARLGPSDFGYHGISAFVDQEPAFPDLLLDYNCGGRTYDTASGYNHQGTDIFTWPFGWNRVDSAAIEVVAGADGVLVGKDDGNPDRSCGGGGAWNAAYVRHADGSVAWYGHMKNGSLTLRKVGDAVVAGDGEHLGVVASSGNSSGPHLHLELHDGSGAVIDPWQGGCNRSSPDSWWAAQRPYYDAAVNRLMTGFAAVVPGTCPAPDITNEAVVFHPGDTIWFHRYYRDQLDTLPSQSTIYRPVGSGATTLDLAGADRVARPGEGDDDNAYVPAFAAGQADPDPAVLGDTARPLVFYQLDPLATPLRLAKTAGGAVALYY